MKEQKRTFFLICSLLILTSVSVAQERELQDQKKVAEEYSERSRQSFVMAAVALGAVVIGGIIRRRLKKNAEKDQ